MKWKAGDSKPAGPVDQHMVFISAEVLLLTILDNRNPNLLTGYTSHFSTYLYSDIFPTGSLTSGEQKLFYLFYFHPYNLVQCYASSR